MKRIILLSKTLDLQTNPVFSEVPRSYILWKSWHLSHLCDRDDRIKKGVTNRTINDCLGIGNATLTFSFTVVSRSYLPISIERHFLNRFRQRHYHMTIFQHCSPIPSRRIINFVKEIALMIVDKYRPVYQISATNMWFHRCKGTLCGKAVSKGTLY